MKKKLIVLMLSMSMTAALVSGCGSTAETAVESTATETVQETATEAETADAESDHSFQMVHRQLLRVQRIRQVQYRNYRVQLLM